MQTPKVRALGNLVFVPMGDLIRPYISITMSTTTPTEAQGDNNQLNGINGAPPDLTESDSDSMWGEPHAGWWRMYGYAVSPVLYIPSLVYQ